MNDELNQAFTQGVEHLIKGGLSLRATAIDIDRAAKRGMAALGQLVLAGKDTATLIADDRRELQRRFAAELRVLAQVRPALASSGFSGITTRHQAEPDFVYSADGRGEDAFARNVHLLTRAASVQAAATSVMPAIYLSMDAGIERRRSAGTAAMIASHDVRRFVTRAINLRSITSNAAMQAISPSLRALFKDYVTSSEESDLDLVSRVAAEFFVSGVTDSLTADFVDAVERATTAYAIRVYATSILGRLGLGEPFFDVPRIIDDDSVQYDRPRWATAQHDAYFSRFPWRLRISPQKGLVLTRDPARNFCAESLYYVRVYARGLRVFERCHVLFVYMTALMFQIDPGLRVRTQVIPGSSDQLFSGYETLLGKAQGDVAAFRTMIDQSADYAYKHFETSSPLRLDSSSLLFTTLNSRLTDSYTHAANVTQCDYIVYQTRNAADGRSLEVGMVDFLCNKGFYGPDQRSTITLAGVKFELAIASNDQKSRVRLVAKQDKDTGRPFVEKDAATEAN